MRHLTGQTVIRARGGHAFFCPDCGNGTELITQLRFVELDSNGDVSYDDFEEHCERCGYDGPMETEGIIIGRLKRRIRKWLKKRRAE